MKSRNFVAGVALLAFVSGGCYPSFHGFDVVPDVSNFWHQPTRTIHVAPGQSERVYWHEFCHGRQGETLPNTDVSLSGWSQTPEGAEFRGTIEQAADVCAYYMMSVPLSVDNSRYDYIEYIDPSWSLWAEKWLRDLWLQENTESGTKSG